MSREVDQSPSLQPWRELFELEPEDPAIARLATISNSLRSLTFRETSSIHQRSSAIAANQPPFADVGANSTHSIPFEYGLHYFFGQYHGKPQSVQQNAIAAIYQNRKGVELWRIMKSVALETPSRKLLITHVRGDRNVEETALAKLLGIDSGTLLRADVSSLGVAYGTVNPFIRHPTIPVLHIFDADLVAGPEYPGDDVVFTSSGDPRFYVGLDIRHYLMATYGARTSDILFDITRSGSPRIFAGRAVEIIGGDSGIDTFEFGKMLLSTLRQRLEERGAYFGDRSLGHLVARSDSALAGSIDTLSYSRQLRDHVLDIVDRIKQSSERIKGDPIITFSSMAMHGIAGRLLRMIEGINYIGPGEAIAQILRGIDKRGIEISFIALLGLSATYDTEHSAFAGDLLSRVLPIDENVMRQIREFIFQCKRESATSREFYEIVKKILQRATRGKLESLRGKTVAIILGASELEGFASTDNNPLDGFYLIKSNRPSVIADEIGKSTDQIRLVLLRPGMAVADMIAQRTLRLESET